MSSKIQNYLKIIVGCKVAHQDGGIWCTNNSKTQQCADELVLSGLLIETTSRYLALSSKDRCFELTEVGIDKYNSLIVSM